MESLKSLIRNVPDFPKPGILFYDITTLLADGDGLRQSIDALANPYLDQSIDVVVGIESRGFIFGTAVADRLGVGFVPVRKPGKLPSTTVRVEYELEYGTDTLEVHKDAVSAGDRVVIIDDLLATGGTAKATIDLLESISAKVVGIGFIIELAFLSGRKKLNKDVEIFSLLEF